LRARCRLPRQQVGARVQAGDQRAGRRPSQHGDARSRRSPGARRRNPRGLPGVRPAPDGDGDARRRGGEDLEARRQLRHGARSDRRSRPRRRALLLPHAEGRLAARLRCRRGARAVGGEPGLLHSDGARADVRHLPCRRDRRGGDHRRRRRPLGAHVARGAGADQGAARLSGARRRRGGGARAAPRRDLSPRHGRQGAPLVPQGARARRARADHARPARARPCHTVRPPHRPRAARHLGAGAHVAGDSAPPSRSTSYDFSHARTLAMTVLVVGSVALDSVETPFGKADNVLGGSGTFFSASASHLAPVQLVGVIGNDYPIAELERSFAGRPIDLAGLERADGASFRWRGRYRHDLNSAETLETHLGVFSNFRPKIPEQFRRAPFVFLGNIDPRLQLEVLTQVVKPKLVACDTMNFWIESRRPDVLALLEQVDLITLNDAEARQLTEEFNIVRAARWIMARGPKHVVIKKGEHGAFMFTKSSIFFAPAYPLESVFDPTGAGDSFAGGFMGYLARSGDLSDENLRRAVVYGSAMGSFAVEKFSVERLLEINAQDIARRVDEFHRLVSFERDLA